MTRISDERAREIERIVRKSREREKRRQEKQRQEKLHQNINPARRVPDHCRLAILTERDPRRARALFTKFFGVTIKDRAFLEWFEALVERAICAGDEHIELPVDRAEVVAILLKAVPTTGQPRISTEKRIRERVLYDEARAEKADHIKKGRSNDAADSIVIRKLRPKLKQWLGKDYEATTIKDRLERRRPRRRR